ncbi:MAG: hypothetical protein ACO20H_00675 [Bacteriovoracaceae bacterium]
MSLPESITMKIMIHLDYLDSLENATQQILRAGESESMDGLGHLTENRERLINILKNYQTILLTEIKHFIEETKPADEETKGILRSWGLDTNQILERTKVLEKNVSQTLENKRTELKKGIIDIQNEKKLTAKYNLSSVK